MAGLLFRLQQQLTKNRRKATYATPNKVEREIYSPKNDVQNSNLTSSDYEERTTDTVSKEDFLLSQIDEFKERAKHLQELLNTKETKADELEALVGERQEKADELDQILNERQEQLDNLSAQMEEQMGSIATQVDGQMDRFVAQVDDRLDDLANRVDGRLDNFATQVDGQMGQMTTRVEGKVGSLASQVEEQIDSLIEKVALKLEELETCMKEDIADGKQFNEKKTQELKEALEQLEAQLANIKVDLSDKVHTENVMCYRNISDLIKAIEVKLEGIGDLDNKLGFIRNFSIIAVVVSAVNFIAIIAMMVITLGMMSY